MFTKSLVNPYEPSHAEIEEPSLALDDQAVIVPYRLDWLALSRRASKQIAAEQLAILGANEDA
jgi:hypothetical protein